MKHSLCIGIINLSPAWRTLLDQIGVWYEEIQSDNFLFQTYSLVIVNSSGTGKHSAQIREYLKSGGNVILINDDYGFFPDKKFRKVFLTRLQNDLTLNGFQHIPYLDLYTTSKTTNKATLSGILKLKKVRKGYVVFIGFDPAERLLDREYLRKPFPSLSGNNPDEIVSRASKGHVSDLFLQVIKEIHFKSNLPFIRKWTSPSIKPVFCFRIDSDYSDRTNLDKVYQFIKNHQIKATWFLHVQAHQEWLSYFDDYKGQEIALHGYRHGIACSKKKVSKNISRGLDKLKESGFEVAGFCAPYGIYNKTLEKSLNQLDFTYTSEFTFAYDSLPLRTSINALQIPIHPICTGSLQRKGYTADDMATYFLDSLNIKINLHEPVIFYHHPMQPGLELFAKVFRVVNKRSLINLTFKEFADFWIKREQTSFEATFENGTGHIKKVPDNMILFEVSFRHGASHLISGEDPFFNVEKKPTIQYYYPKRSKYTVSEPSFIEKLNLLKTSMLDYKNRERL